MAIRAGTAPADGKRPEPLFSVLVDYPTLAGRVCELANGTVITPGALVPWLDRAWVERIVFGSPSRVIDVGEARRLFRGATRRAVEVRDRQCYHPYCEEPVEHCQADHIEPWSQGGPTTQANGRLACGFHNRLRHRRGPPQQE
ncbi:MAG: HNH endonuclease signature motif containing protein [Acidimicrobiales bacterium]